MQLMLVSIGNLQALGAIHHFLRPSRYVNGPPTELRPPEKVTLTILYGLLGTGTNF